MRVVLLNSREHWRNGWIGDAHELERSIEALDRAGCRVEVVEVEDPRRCAAMLARLPKDTLVWTNAYYVGGRHGARVMLNTLAENAGLPVMGSSARALHDMLYKDVCQRRLRAAGVPVPASHVLRRGCFEEDLEGFRASDLTAPWVLKPTAESSSRGVHLVRSHYELERRALGLLEQFTTSDVLIEAFLPSADVTCGYVRYDGRTMLLPSYYVIRGRPGETTVLSYEARQTSWSGEAKALVPVEDEDVLDQLRRWVPQIVEVLGVRDVTRIDGRLDARGRLRFFDVNGFPGLGAAESTGVAQVRSFFRGCDPGAVYDAYLYTIVGNACLRMGLPVPAKMRAHNLMTLWPSARDGAGARPIVID